MIKLTQLLRESQQYQIYCDMDGVLVDFVTGYEKFMGKPTGQIYKTPEERKQFWDDFNNTVEQRGMKEHQYWAGLPPLKNGLLLWKKIKKFDPIILSAPSYNVAESKKGKLIWVKKYLGNPPTIINYQKQKWATPTSILIDDRKDFITKWEAAGGIGILHKDNNIGNTLKKLNQYILSEELNESQNNPNNIKAYYEALCKNENITPLPVKFGNVGGSGAATTYNPKTMKPLYISFDVKKMSDPEYAVIHELTHQIKLETEGDAYVGKRDRLTKFRKLENKLVDKYMYSQFSKLLWNNS